MTQFTPNTVAGSRPKARPNVYTLLLLVAFLALSAACVYVLFRHHELFGSWNPFDLSHAQPVASAAWSLLESLV